MEPIITKLNQVVQNRISSLSRQSPTVEGETSPFQKTFGNRLAEKLMEKINEDFSLQSGGQVKALSIDDIHVNTANTEAMSVETKAGDKLFDAFQQLNKDMVSLDTTLETMQSPGFKMNARNLFMLQAGVTKVGLYAEAVSKVTDGFARGINTVINVQT